MNVAYAAGVIDPRGPVAEAERNLIVAAVLIMLVIVVPILVAFFVIARKYREGNAKAAYEPEGKRRRGREVWLWAAPTFIVIVLSAVNWYATHALDPSKPLQASARPLAIQVVALDWKWLFIYPEQNIATVNFVEFPAATPVRFELTADAPMNSFWIPQLSGQIYAMAGMVNQLNLMASAPGEYLGKAAEINGKGYAGMNFIAKAASQSDFDAWVASVKQLQSPLTADAYNQLAEPSENVPRASYSSVADGLYNNIVMKSMTPSSTK